MEKCFESDVEMPKVDVELRKNKFLSYILAMRPETQFKVRMYDKSHSEKFHFEIIDEFCSRGVEIIFPNYISPKLISIIFSRGDKEVNPVKLS